MTLENQMPSIPQGVGEILDYLKPMMFCSPKFEDDSGYFPYKNIETEFKALNEGLRLIRTRLGEEKYATLIDMSARMKTHFEADPEDENGECLAGRE